MFPTYFQINTLFSFAEDTNYVTVSEISLPLYFVISFHREP